MGNANIDEELRQEIFKILENPKYRVKYQNLKGFIDNSCLNELEKIKHENKK